MTSTLLLLSSAWALSSGDLVITEIMASPASNLAEWVEIHNPTSSAVELSGLEIADDLGHTMTISESITLPAGGFAVVVDDKIAPAADIVIEHSTLKLGNKTGAVTLSVGGVLLDSVSYSPSGGYPSPYLASLTLDQSYFDNGLNDEGSWWCKAESRYSGAHKGTPGSANDDCPTPMLGVMPGDLVITELMIDPAATTDLRGEWIEILNTTDERIDLKGMVVTDDSGSSFISS